VLDFSREAMFAATQRRVLQPFFSKSGFIFANGISMVVDLTDGPTGLGQRRRGRECSTYE